jgi:hypothetical protein
LGSKTEVKLKVADDAERGLQGASLRREPSKQRENWLQKLSRANSVSPSPAVGTRM